LAEISVFGLLIFVLMMKEIFKRLKVIIAQKNFSTLVLTSILVGVFIIFFFDHYFWSLPFGILLWGLVLGWWERSLGKIESP
jgi:hypothetical protein